MYAILNYNPQLRPYTEELTRRVTHFQTVKDALAPSGSLARWPTDTSISASTTIRRAGCTESGRRRRSSFG